MKLGLLCTIVMVAALVSAASAGSIHATGSGDGVVQYSYTCNYLSDHEQESWESYTVTSLAAASLPVEYVYYVSGSPPWFGSETIWDYEAVFVFDISSLRSGPAPSSVQLWFYSPSGVDTFNRYYHSNVDLGGTVVQGYHPRKGNFTQVGTLTQASGWISLDVTSQIAQDIARGFYHSTFSVGYGICTIGSSEGGYGAYLESPQIPEPASIFVLLFGFSGSAIAAFRRRR